MQVLHYNSKKHNPNFQRFIKVKGAPHEINRLKLDLMDYSEDIITITKKKDENSNILYIMSGETSDKFIDLIPKMWFRKLRSNLEKYLGQKPEKIKPKDLEKDLKKKSFRL